jgi:hypothetical protein
MHGTSIEAMHLAHQEQPKTFSSKMFKKITKEGKQRFGAWIQEIRSWVSRHGLDMFQGSQRLLKMCQRYCQTSSTKTPKNDHEKHQKKRNFIFGREVTYEFGLLITSPCAITSHS